MMSHCITLLASQLASLLLPRPSSGSQCSSQSDSVKNKSDYITPLLQNLQWTLQFTDGSAKICTKHSKIFSLPFLSNLIFYYSFPLLLCSSPNSFLPDLWKYQAHTCPEVLTSGFPLPLWLCSCHFQVPGQWNSLHLGQCQFCGRRKEKDGRPHNGSRFCSEVMHIISQFPLDQEASPFMHLLHFGLLKPGTIPRMLRTR